MVVVGEGLGRRKRRGVWRRRPNEATRTYFSGTKWAELIFDYEMEAGDRCTLILDLDGTTYFHFVDPNDSDDE